MTQTPPETILCLGSAGFISMPPLLNRNEPQLRFRVPWAEVEHCAGEGQLTKAFTLLGYKGKRFDVSRTRFTSV